MSNIFFTSDTHFGHTNIAGKKVSKWKDGYRDYNCVDDMNIDLVKAINEIVKEDDTLYHLGDWSFGGIENIWNFRKQLICKNIHLILGNHDHHIEENKQLKILAGDRGLLQHLDIFYDPYKNFEGNSHVDARDLFSSVNFYKEVTIEGKVYCLSHYGHRVWHGSHKGWIHLYGHSHGSLPPYGKSMDVGVDVALDMYAKPRPFSLAEIKFLMNKQPLEFPDHHDLSTNTGKPQGAKSR